MTHYNIKRNNKAEKIFYGRVDISFAMSLLYFSNVSVVQNLIHELKYNGRKDVGILLGKMMGRAIGDSDCFNDIDYIVPLPLSKRKKLIRGYNQSELLCDGISKIVQKPVLIDKVIRSIDTASQTRKHRKERWQNVEKIFVAPDKTFFDDKHILLVDDVLTTGATLEACASVILEAYQTRVSIATLAITTR
jgi:ComF family protein